MIRSRYSYRLREPRPARRSALESYRLLFVALGVLLAIMAVAYHNLSRPYRFLREVENFMVTLPRRSVEEIERETRRLARGLENSNLLIQQGAVAVLRVTTGKDLGDNPDVWRVWWRAVEPTWRYERRDQAGAAP
ncbi:MAG: hypothetical protein NZ483_05590 [Verrucomicrobiae bacterium]|nr:hypothetical protein [Verrucomicrobiae bacterium]MDW8343995.1 hypothetical protein [Verrucomicrobiae bacterium]